MLLIWVHWLASEHLWNLLSGASLTGLYAPSLIQDSPGRRFFSVARAVMVLTDLPGYDETFFQVLSDMP
jgi:hypothetical protein